ncbi:Asp-tRNA(Asn)/Glu-tRNA(Gln) amidotransferase subunit GatA [Patescibacteria group bacterium]|nr:Asp-tRNA(Asn)/Glu-tRNA(Gln) amidotransferase subunit GatA [Patescibacteria group bacterium]MBU1256800.1 Asp-tRNA(Asn)/Glu-tRNA(Gln) amidotransferase subunit GatA [Patescibacteria group bacterium]MBU1457351.1 Asp-tRNA(Asn)/Glu-tRNA(Gln) amidotransferase subunit GatA [Patescibacteria group bacterium]
MENLLNKTIPQIQEMIAGGKLSYFELMGEIENNVKEKEDDIKAYLTLDLKKAKLKAKKLDGVGTSLLNGIPMSVKDTFVTSGVKTTVASKMLADFVPEYDAVSYKRLIDSGALLVGKTNMDEFAHGFTTEYSAFQVTRNPWNLNNVPGGSSGGAAASIASRTALIALASENFGSIVQPAALCGVVGIKPTYGRASRYGIIAMASSLECPGIMARCVEDAAIGLEAIVGVDPLDATTLNVAKERFYDQLNLDVKGKKIAVIKPIMQAVSAEIVLAIEEMIRVYKKMGVEVREIDWYDLDIDSKIYDILYRSEVASNLARYDGIRYGYRTEKETKTLDELYQQNRDMFGKHVKRQIVTAPITIDKDNPRDSIYYQALKIRRKNRDYIDKLFLEYDAIVTPATTFGELAIGKTADEKWREENRNLARINGTAMCPTVLYGYPSISFPIGFLKPTAPVGVHVFSKRLNEQGILNLAYAYQEATGLKCLTPKT